MANQTKTAINLNEFPFECACGECYSTIRAAAVCRKCRNYSVFGYCTHVIDQRTGEVVHGTEPTEKEYEVAALEWESMRAIERKEAEMWEAERRAEEAHYLDMLERQAAELAEDQLWDIQERLMAS
jgi:hypothetical protein